MVARQQTLGLLTRETQLLFDNVRFKEFELNLAYVVYVGQVFRKLPSVTSSYEV